MGRVIVVGSANLDLRIRQAHAVAPGETLLAHGADHELGGKGLNQAIAARRAGADVEFVGAVGSDAAGADIRRLLDDEGVGASRVAMVDGRSGLAVVTISDDGENSIVVVPGANGSLTPDAVRAAMADTAEDDVVVCQLEIPLPCVEAAARASRAAGSTFLLNAAPAHPGALGILEWTDVLVVNDTELAGITGGAGIAADPGRSAGLLAERRGLAVVHTAGAEGAWLHRPAGASFHPARAVRAVDTTAAGDTFIGYLAAALATGRALDEGMDVATVAASVTVTRSGSVASIPRAAELPVA